MSKFLKVMIVLLTIAAMASPAMAEIKLNGYYRLQGTVQSPTDGSAAAYQGQFENFLTTPANKTAGNNAFFDQRLRLKMTDNLNDNISVVYYGELDAPFGAKSSKLSAGNGGQLSADGNMLETKNFYVDFKVPSSDWSVRTGIQGFGFGHYESFVTDDDMTGISTRGTVGPIALTAGWFVWNRGQFSESAGVNFYSLNGEMKVNDQLKFGLTAADVKNDSAAAKNGTAAKTDDWYYGAYGDFTMAKIGFAGSLLFRNAVGQDNNLTDGQTFMLNLYAKAKLANAGNIKVHGIYIPADTSSKQNDRFSANQAGYELPSDNLMIFGTDAYYNNGSQGGLAVYSSAYAGYGLMALMVSGDYKLPEAAYLKYGAGYFMAADKSPTHGVAKDNANLGAEFDAMVGKKFAEKYDLSLRGAYGLLGDFYKVGGQSPDDLYKVVAMLNVSF
ncbi:hypothetical protein [Geopsychrobacter electrodiphilus]|uniref:hypothetical protein n=1 Tax=Geopsychrobacter electrodiphilus TaxID=225196 RepID=UPI000373A2D9|nr:hypothetical protein [Geopsychrobacter electrodiphilus]